MCQTERMVCKELKRNISAISTFQQYHLSIFATIHFPLLAALLLICCHIAIRIYVYPYLMSMVALLQSSVFSLFLIFQIFYCHSWSFQVLYLFSSNLKNFACSILIIQYSFIVIHLFFQKEQFPCIKFVYIPNFVFTFTVYLFTFISNFSPVCVKVNYFKLILLMYVMCIQQ